MFSVNSLNHVLHFYFLWENNFVGRHFLCLPAKARRFHLKCRFLSRFPCKIVVKNGERGK